MLAILKDLFNELNAQNIRYIHWKSNEHLQAAINGDTDLDIMVHVEDKKICTDNTKSWFFFVSISGETELHIDFRLYLFRYCISKSFAYTFA
ncbi:hypothetical protein GCM10025853_18800 [Tetragenococcus halophilus subsp. halophilus DSM 20339]|nr:hypothetical protein GCM10025853_18800 [Tetragenococcus halophilus subsp. halophilus DSM 20339]